MRAIVGLVADIVSEKFRLPQSFDDAAADNRFLRKRPPCLPAHQKYSKQRQAERDQNQCKHKSTRSSIASIIRQV
jgi:hypothetical protein